MAYGDMKEGGREGLPKVTLPFRLGTTSYILDAGLVENARFLCSRLEDMELVLFKTKDLSNIPDRHTISELRSVALDSGLSFTVHLPADIFLGHHDEGERLRSVKWALRIIELTSPLDPFAFIVHFHGERRGRTPAGEPARWIDALAESVRGILSTGIPPGMLCVETLDYPFRLIEEIVFENRLSVCLDIGHLAFYGYDVAEHLNRYLPLTKVIHLHGHQNGSDHKALSLLDAGLLSGLAARPGELTSVPRVATLEVFNLADLNDSISFINAVFGRRGRPDSTASHR